MNNIVQTDDVWSIEVPNLGYASAPTMIKTSNGEIAAVYSGGSRHHVCPFGQLHLITSRDEGKTWTWPRVLADSVLDDRDAGILQTRNGTLVVNWFTSVAWEWVMDNGSQVWHAGRPIKIADEEEAEWQRRRARLTDEIRWNDLGVWSIRSSDGGVTWSNRVSTKVGSPHGPCELSDGRLLYVGKKAATDWDDALTAQHSKQGNIGGPYGPDMGVSESTDDGASWQLIADIPVAPGDVSRDYHELHAVQASNGDIIAHIRNQNETSLKYETLQTESKDGGYTWSEPHSIGLWGYPAFLKRTSDGRLMTTIGHRREPNGNKVAISEDHGQTWSTAMSINTDSAKDFGYPSTVELAPNTFLTLWYDVQDRDLALLRLARWRLV